MASAETKPAVDSTRPVSAPRGLRFALVYAGIAGVMLTLYCIPYRELGLSEAWFDRYLHAYAVVVGAVLQVFERDIEVTGTTILGRYPLTIVKNCDAMEVKILLVSAVLALPGIPLVRRLAAAGAALASVVVINVVRIVSLFYAGVFVPASFERLHMEIWPLVLVVVAVLEFLLIVRFFEQRARVRRAP